MPEDPPPNRRGTHRSIRSASVFRSFSSQVSFSSAMIFSVSYKSRKAVWGEFPVARSQGFLWCQRLDLFSSLILARPLPGGPGKEGLGPSLT